MSLLLKIVRKGFVAFLILSVFGVLGTLGIYLYLAPGLPPVATLKDVQLQTPLRVFTRDGELIAEYGEKRRKPLRIEQVPKMMREAFLAAEDDRFFEHPGVDYQGLARAAVHLIRTGEKGQGGSTITMQLARNFFLTRERTYTRKLREIFLALKIERELTKDEILELYLNKIYLGNRAYGVGAAAEVYYGKDAHELDLAQMAMIAGLPKAPSAFNPIANPERAVLRRNYVLGRMRGLHYIDESAYQAALGAPVSAWRHGLAAVAVEAPYVGEMVRSEMLSRYGAEAYTGGYRAYTTIDATLQKAANAALHDALLSYSTRHGYHGSEAHVAISESADLLSLQNPLAQYRVVGALHPAIVVEVVDKQARVLLKGGETVTLEWDGLSWARRYIHENSLGPKPTSAQEILQRGDIVRVRQTPDGAWRLSQIPRVAGALVSLSPTDGTILALVGGFDFQQSKFNRVTQAKRQAGSNFKPFIYSAALEKGFTPASLINDAPIVFQDATLEGTWRPENYSGKFFGPTRLRVALTKSRNLVSIRLLNTIGVEYAREYINRFGFQEHDLPRDLSLALGSAAVTPLELATGYAVFPNGGYRIHPYLIEHVDTSNGDALFRAEPEQACEEPSPQPTPVALDTPAQAPGTTGCAPRAIEATNAYQIVSMMRDVVRAGTGRKAMALGRSDLAGKTGTTNDQRDAWFSGYNGDIVTTAWVGFDDQRPLGARETGAAAALPMWIDYMRVALKDRPEHNLDPPRGMVTVRIDPRTGLLASAGEAGAIFETFRAERAPKRRVSGAQGNPGQADPHNAEIPEQLF
jgi:penicillin-binding protein 1A